MKRIIVICLLLISGLVGYSQSPVNRANAANTVRDWRWMAGYNLFVPVYNDTIQASLSSPTNFIGIDSCGAFIYTRNPQAYWRRDCSPKRWTRMLDVSNLGSDFFFDSTCNCFKIDTSALIGIINTYNTDSSITSISILNDSTARICFSSGSCVNIGFVTNITNISNVYFVGGDSIAVCGIDTTGGVVVSDCDTVPIGITPATTIYQNALRKVSNVVELGGIDLGDPQGWLYRNTWINTRYSQLNLIGNTVYDVPINFGQIQTSSISSGIVSLLSSGAPNGLSPSPLDTNNVVKLYFNYVSSKYDNSISGYAGDKIGYMINTNLIGAGSYGMVVNNGKSKWSSLLFHTLDTLNDDALTILGGRPPLSTYVAEIGGGGNLLGNRIVTFSTNKSIRWFGYDNASSFITSDTANKKPLAVDANGNQYRMSYWPGGGGGNADVVDTSNTSITLSIDSANYYIFTGGSSEVFSLPSSPTSNSVFNIKSVGVGALVVSGSGNNIYDSDTPISDYLLLTGDAVTMEWNGAYWVASNNVKKIHSKTLASSTSIVIDFSEGYQVIDIDLEDSTDLDIINTENGDIGLISIKNINGSNITFHGQELPLNPIADSYTNLEWRNRGGTFVFTSSPSTVGVNTTTSYDVDAQIYFDAMATAGTTLTTDEKDAVNAFVLDEKGGGRWTKTQFYYPNLGLTSAAQAINLKSPGTFNQTFNGGWSYTSNGAIPNGSNTYSNTGWNPSTNVTLNSVHVCVYTNTPTAVGINNNKGLFGIYDGGSGDALYLYPYYSGNAIFSANCPFSPLNQVSAADGDVGFYLISRVASGNFFFQYNTTQTTKSVSSTSIPNGNLYIADVNGSADKSLQNICFAAGGTGLTTTEANARQAAVATLMTALGR